MIHDKSIIDVIDFIENNLSNNLKVDNLAKIACMSPFHFHRTFSNSTGEKVIDYIIKRRLTRAAFDLLDTDKSIIRIAMDYGFNSQQAFTRSFKNLFNISPKKYRAEYVIRLNSVKTKVDFKTLIPNPNFRFERRRQMMIIGYKALCLNNGDQAMTAIYNLFDKLKNEYTRLQYAITGSRVYLIKEVVAIDDKEYLELFLGIDMDNNGTIYDGMITKEVQDREFIVFEHRGAVDKIARTHDIINNLYLPNIGVEIDDSYSIDIFRENMFDFLFYGQRSPQKLDIKMKDWYMFKNFFNFEIHLLLKDKT